MFIIFFIGIILASCSLGAAQASIQKTGEYLKVRKQFGKSLAEFQVKIEMIFSTY
jgi:alkylation response protein AidB-like acyl-CoA dehydrogenase